MNIKSKKHAHIEHGWSVSKTMEAVLLHNLRYLQEWEEAARNWEDIEGVHQVRVSFRRMRSALNTFRLAVPKKVSRQWSGTMRDLVARLGPARDLDVFIDESLGEIGDTLELPGKDKLAKIAQKARASAYRDVVAMLDSPDYARFKKDFRAWCESRAWERAELKKKHRTLLEGGTAPFARKVLDRQERRVLEAGTHVDKYDAAAMHRLRIECKKLRYGAEFFVPVFAGMEVFICHMKGLQDLLGVMNDVSVMRQLLDHILRGVSDTETLQYAGGIIGWRTREYQELLKSFEQRWEEFVEAKHPWWKKASPAEAPPTPTAA
jgi:CHAD domain-containing protein